MTQQLTVRNVPDEVIEALKAEAAEDGTSLNAVLRAALVERAEQWERARRVRETLPRLDALRQRIAEEHGSYLPDSAALVRQDRDR